MNGICLMLAGLFAWCALTSGHATYQVDQAPVGTVTRTVQP